VRNTYAGFGLQLRSAFALPGMVPQPATGLPSLELELQTPAQLEDAWSGSASPRPWRGRLGDGEVFAVEWGREGDLRFAYGERARFLLDRAGGHLGCAPQNAQDFDWLRVLITRVLPNVSLARGREALHASAVETPTGVLAVAAPSGMGKSTLATEMLGRGCPLFADDTVVLERRDGEVLGHPGSPHTNLPAAEAERAEALGSLLAELGEERWLALSDIGDRPRRLAAVVILERAPGKRLEAMRLDSSPLPLAPYMLGLPDEEDERAAARFGLYSDLAESVPLWRLSADSAASAAELADALESALELRFRAAAGGAA
jgi:hypothetical protein